MSLAFITASSGRFSVATARLALSFSILHVQESSSAQKFSAFDDMWGALGTLTTSYKMGFSRLWDSTLSSNP